MTPFRNAPAADKLEGPSGESGICLTPSRTASHPSNKPKFKRVAGAIRVVPDSSRRPPAGWSSTSIFPESATAASVPSKGRYAKAGEAAAARHSKVTDRNELFASVDAEILRS